MISTVLSPLFHDGIAYAPGDVVDAGLFTTAQMEHLISTGTLTPVHAHDPASEDEGAGTADLAVPASTPAGKSRKA